MAAPANPVPLKLPYVSAEWLKTSTPSRVDGVREEKEETLLWEMSQLVLHVTKALKMYGPRRHVR